MSFTQHMQDRPINSYCMLLLKMSAVWVRKIPLCNIPKIYMQICCFLSKTILTKVFYPNVNQHNRINTITGTKIGFYICCDTEYGLVISQPKHGRRQTSSIWFLDYTGYSSCFLDHSLNSLVLRSAAIFTKRWQPNWYQNLL